MGYHLIANLKEHKKTLIFGLFGAAMLAMNFFYQWNYNSSIHVDFGYGDVLLHKAKDLKRILLWTKFFSSNYESYFLEHQYILVRYCKKPCVISRKRSDPELYDALVFHIANFQNPPAKRTPHQVYIAFTMESPVKQKWYYMGGNYYNWSASVLRGSTIPVHYNRAVRKVLSISDLSLQSLKSGNNSKRNGEAVIMWVVSNCNAPSKRQLYVKQLQTHIAVDIFGWCGKICSGSRADSCYGSLTEKGKYKFYLAFENAVCKDYITEKPFKALEIGLVPIVLGGLSSDDYTQPGVLPPNSFIDVRNFSSPKHLADYLHLLNNNDTLYMSYHKWRSEYSLSGGGDWLCDICDALYEKNMTKRTSLDWDEYYDPNKLCDNQLVSRLLRKG